jgi:hypothetical protein
VDHGIRPEDIAKYYIGIDVSKERSASWTGKGKIAREIKLPSDPEIILLVGNDDAPGAGSGLT